MSHVSEKRWNDIAGQLATLSNEMLGLLSRVRQLSIQLYIIGVRAGSDPSSDEALARQLFKEQIAQRQVASDAAYYAQNPEGTEPPVVTPTALEIQMVNDARAVATALNELWEAAHDMSVAQRDRANDLHKIA